MKETTLERAVLLKTRMERLRDTLIKNNFRVSVAGFCEFMQDDDLQNKIDKIMIGAKEKLFKLGEKKFEQYREEFEELK